ncbi:hypothetical protein MNB_SV-13-713 [hydrothermal vent metagenome]|uniref:Lipoprotein n=1 Tax=hydrothermal vent metagenome TaxID=652676 RepID=A0A1W1CT73_9ZZZZ
MDKFKSSMAMVAIFGLIGCGDTTALTGEDSIRVSVEDILGLSKPADRDKGGTSIPETDVIKTNITSDPVDAIDIFETKSVGYTLKSSSLPVCYNTGDVRLDYEGALKTYTCRWLCGIYEGDGPIEVKLIFTKSGTWTLTNEELLTASSRCK